MANVQCATRDQVPGVEKSAVSTASTVTKSPSQRSSSNGSKKIVNFIRGIGRSSSKASNKDKHPAEVSPTLTEASMNSSSTDSNSTSGSNKKLRRSRVLNGPAIVGRSGSFQSAKTITHPLDIVPASQTVTPEQRQYATFAQFPRRRHDESEEDSEDDCFQRTFSQVIRNVLNELPSRHLFLAQSLRQELADGDLGEPGRISNPTSTPPSKAAM
ncbi:hypothetical protein L228DRAFT_237959 [Xylona heveae TC161]|uniref:Uncharacterized protein n=1 Tax=Xylona heveae (strain CBS 132557 / TC161) TaxID=1328760 RepID=A0A165HEC7_XYLHT|nr:hypothetical protein L228DRAFT_237959 [Xylona heveae TC161]KZF23383.1 hypothetical protein L228DRAFT_237959 [Xylona heveae TC161]